MNDWLYPLGCLFLAGWACFSLLAGWLLGGTMSSEEAERGYRWAALALMVLALSGLLPPPTVPASSFFLVGRGVLWGLFGLGLMRVMETTMGKGTDVFSTFLCLAATLLTAAIGVSRLQPFPAAGAVAAWGVAAWRLVRLGQKQIQGSRPLPTVAAFLLYLWAMSLVGAPKGDSSAWMSALSLALAASGLPLMNLDLLLRVRRANEEARLWRRRLAMILDAFHGMIFIGDRGGETLSALTIEGPLRVQRIEALFPSSVAPTIRETFLKTALLGESQTILFSVGSGSNERWYEGRTARLPRTIAGGGVLFVCRDRTEQIRLEHAARASLEKYNRLFHDSPDALFVLDDENRIMEMNERAEILFEADRDALNGQPVRRVMANLSDSAMNDVETAILARWQYTTERMFQRLSGTTFPGEWRVTRFRLGDRMIRLAVVRDLTERRQDEERLEQAGRLEAVGQFAGILAHDFNNVLSGIGGCLELLAQRVDPGSERALILDVMRQAVKRGTALTQQLLAFARQRGGAPVPVEARALLRELHELILPSLPLSLLLQTHPLAVSLWFLADPSEVRQALLHLIFNAADAMPGGGEITLSAEGARRMAVEGSGDRSSLSAGEYVIFRMTFVIPGFTGTAHDRLGIGLVHGLVRNRGGYVEIEEERAGKVTVVVGFPRCPPPAEGDDKERSGTAPNGRQRA